MAPQIGEKLEFAPGYSLAQYITPASFDGKTLQGLNLRKKYRINLIGLRRGNTEIEDGKKLSSTVINVPLPETVLHTGDLLWVVGSDEDLASLPNQ